MASTSQLSALVSCEYKVMLDHRMFDDAKSVLAMFEAELVVLCKTLPKVKLRGKFKLAEKREIVFLDTIDQLIADNRLILRQRIERVKRRRVEYTLKCRSPDRHFAVGADVRAGRELAAKIKLEEDVGPPFVSRFSLSSTVEGKRRMPRNLREAARYFPVLKRLERDGRRCPLKLKLAPVNGVRAFERVFAGMKLKLPKTNAEVAVILWSNGRRGRPLVAEFSFRYPVDEGSNSRETALAAMRVFESLQQLDWCLPDARTKTRYVYREA